MARRTEEELKQETVLFNKHVIPIPETLKDRVQEVYTGIASEKLERAVTLMVDPDGILLDVQRSSDTPTSERRAEEVQAALEGILAQLIYHRHPQPLDRAIAWNTLLYSRGWIRVEMWPRAWESLSTVSLDGTRTKEMEKQIDDIQKENERKKRSKVPFRLEIVPPGSIRAVTDGEGFTEIWEIRRVKAIDVLNNWVDEHNLSRAKLLRSNFDSGYITDEHEVTLVIRTDRTHIQVAITSDAVLAISLREGESINVGESELIFEDEHGLGEVPYAYFPGRQRETEDEAFRYNGFIRPITDLVFALDTAETQRATGGRFSAWPGIAIEKRQDTIGEGDRGKQIEVPEGAVVDILGPGESLAPIRWLNTEDFQILDRQIASYRQQIDLHTFGPSSYGMSANSGYEYAQITADVQAPLEPFLVGLQIGWSHVCRLLLKQALRFMTETSISSIPIRNTRESDRRYITLTKDLAAQDYDIKVKVTSKPVGGEMAQLQVQTQKMTAGLATPTDVLIALGDRSPQRTLDAVAVARVVNSQQVQDLILNMVLQRIQPALSNANPPNIPGGAQIPEALHNALQSLSNPQQPSSPTDPSQSAQFPGGGVFGAPGASSNIPTSPPVPTQATLNGGRSPENRRGVPYGQGPTLPGGLNRQSDILSLNQ